MGIETWSVAGASGFAAKIKINSLDKFFSLFLVKPLF